MRRTVSWACAFGALFSSWVLWSCASTGGWDRLPPADQDAFQRCAETMRPTLCGRDTDTVYVTICMRNRMSDYASGADEDMRREWLLAHGCPPSMVSPRAYMPSSGGERSAPSAAPSCNLPVRSVQVCLSRLGYRFAVPSPSECPAGSTAAGIVPVNCASINSPAYHACIDDSGNWTPVVSWETCEAHGLYNTTGDFVPPGRAPGAGVGPDRDHPAAPMTTGRAATTITRTLRCYTPTGAVVPVERRASCSEVGLSDSPP